MNEIISHPFFADIDFEKLLRKEIEPPLTPDVVSPKDLQHFDQSLTAEPVRESVLPEEAIKKIQEKNDAFAKFAVTHDSDSLGA